MTASSEPDNHSVRHHAFARSDKTPLGNWWWTMDRWLLGATVVLILAGILLSFGNSPAAASRIAPAFAETRAASVS